MRSFLSAHRFEPDHQPILVHINADHLLRDHQSWLVVLGHKMLIHRFYNDVFDVGCGNAGDRSDCYRLGLSLEMRQRGVIAIADSSFGGVGWNHAVARIVVQQAGQEMVGFGFGVPVFAIADGLCCGLSGIEAEDCSLASLRQIFLTLLAAGAQRSVLGGKIADTRRPGPPPVGGGTRLWYSCYDIFLREGQPMTHGTPPFSADAALRHFRSYFTEPKDVVAHPQLSRDEKLAILREWEQKSEERRVGKEGRTRGAPDHLKKKMEESIGVLERSPR